ncbi:MAG: hypothetical protein QG652_823 [Pseudomonadota bacterium]|nr:hypothetical protein [Pseudomonadota bacterium]
MVRWLFMQLFCLPRFLVSRLLCLVCASLLSSAASAGLFGYQATQSNDLKMFPQWPSVLERHIRDNVPEGQCLTRKLDSCHVQRWQVFLNSLRKLPAIEQMRRVNEFANRQAYILDIENYGMEDFWATPRQFLYNNGDCEDYAITKLLSLKQLGYDTSQMRIVILQDTNLRIAHAVLAVDYQGDTLILDNQVPEVVSHRYVVHYVPIYSVNEQHWWMYLPN